MRAAEALGQLEDAQAVEPLIAALEDANEDMRQVAAKGLGQLGDIRAVEPLLSLLKGSRRGYEYDAQAAIEALGNLGDTRAIEILIAKLTAGGVVQEAAIKVLGQLGDASAVDPLIAVLRDKPITGHDDKYYSFRSQVAETLATIGQLNTELLVSALKDEDEDVRWAVDYALRRIKERNKS